MTVVSISIECITGAVVQRTDRNSWQHTRKQHANSTHANTQEIDWTGFHSMVIKFLKVWTVAVLVTAGSRFLGWERYTYPDPDSKQETALFRPGGRELVLLICEQSDLIINDSSAQSGGRGTRWILRLCSTSRSGAANLSCHTHPPPTPTTLSHCAG